MGYEKPLIPRTLLTSPVNLSESKTGRSSRRASSCGSCVHPSIGIPFAAPRMPQRLAYTRIIEFHTFITVIANRRVINQTDFSQISLYYSKVFGI